MEEQKDLNTPPLSKILKSHLTAEKPLTKKDQNLLEKKKKKKKMFYIQRQRRSHNEVTTQKLKNNYIKEVLPHKISF